MKLKSILTSATICLAAPSLSPAATATWKGGTVGTPDTWNISQNWIGGIGPSGNDAVFPSGASFIGMMQNTDSTTNSITVNAAGYGFSSSAVGGGLKVSAGITANFSGTGSVTFDTTVRLDAAQTWNMNGSRGTMLWNEDVNLNGKTLTLTGTGIHEINGGCSGAGNLIKNGTGRLELNNAVSGGGGMVINEGTVAFNHITETKTVALIGGIVTGNGSLTSLNGQGGTVSPGGAATAALTIQGMLSLASAATLDIDLNGSAAGTGYDQLLVTGSVTLTNPTLTFAPGSAFVPLIGAPMRLIDNQGANPVTGTFAGLPEGATVVQGNVTFRISYTGGTGNDVTLTVISVAPAGVERVWTGNVDQFWATPGNWAGGIAPQPGDSVQFPEVAAVKKSATNNFPPGYPLHLVRFTAGGYSLTGFGAHLSDGIVQQAPAGSAANSVTFDLSLPAPGAPAESTRVRLQSGGDLTVDPSGGFTLPLAASALTLQNDVAGALLKSGIAVAGGAGVIAKHGAGPVKLEAASAHGGGTHVYAGVLQAAVTGALGNAVVGVDPGAILEIGTAGGPALAFLNLLDLGGTLRTAGTPQHAWNGTIQLQNGFTGNVVAQGGGLNLTGKITGNGGITYSGSAQVTIGGFQQNDYTGATAITGIVVNCNKANGISAIPGNLSASGTGCIVLAANTYQIGPYMDLHVSGGAAVHLGGSHVLHDVALDAGTLTTASTLHISGSIESIAAGETSVLEGTIVTGGAQMPWVVGNGAAHPDLLFTGSLGTPATPPMYITKSGEGVLRVADGAGSAHHNLTLTIASGIVDWADLPDGTGPFGPDVILDGGTLYGAGCVRNISVFSGINRLEPGFGGGTMQCNNLTLRSNLTLDAETVPAGTDRLKVSGTVDLANSVLQLYGSAPDYGSTWVLIDNDNSDAVNGNFSGLPEGATLTFGTALMQVSYTGGDGNDVTLTRVPPPAPELDSIDLAGNIAGGGHPGSPPARFHGTGIPGFTYGLEISEDLEHWVSALTATADAEGGIRFDWNPPVIPARRFFRVRAL